jgi:hypothetical protein
LSGLKRFERSKLPTDARSCCGKSRSSWPVTPEVAGSSPRFLAYVEGIGFLSQLKSGRTTAPFAYRRGGRQKIFVVTSPSSYPVLPAKFRILAAIGHFAPETRSGS